MRKIMLKFLLLSICVVSVVAVKGMFENFEHVSGFNATFFNLRVRKFNRTTKALNGTIFLKQSIGNDVQFSLDLFHSRLGNQQFNHYPMKLPTSGVCDFFDHLHNNYEDSMSKVENLPAKGECPFSPRSVIVWDFVFPSEVLPPVLPRGLWKALITGKLNGQPWCSYYFLVKLTDEY